MKYFKYTKKELEVLKNNDPILKQYIDKYGMIKREVTDDLYTSLISSIVSQQISLKAAITVFDRLTNIVKEYIPENILKIDDNTLQECGLSFRKVTYIKNASTFFIENKDFIKNINKYSNEEIIEKMTIISGVGVWTVEMLLIFTLQRKNVISYNDLAIRKSMEKIYKIDKLSKKEFDSITKHYDPYQSIASLYIWNAAHVEQ